MMTVMNIPQIVSLGGEDNLPRKIVERTIPSAAEEISGSDVSIVYYENFTPLPLNSTSLHFLLSLPSLHFHIEFL